VQELRLCKYRKAIVRKTAVHADAPAWLGGLLSSSHCGRSGSAGLRLLDSVQQSFEQARHALLTRSGLRAEALLQPAHDAGRGLRQCRSLRTKITSMLFQRYLLK